MKTADFVGKCHGREVITEVWYTHRIDVLTRHGLRTNLGKPYKRRTAHVLWATVCLTESLTKARSIYGRLMLGRQYYICQYNATALMSGNESGSVENPLKEPYCALDNCDRRHQIMKFVVNCKVPASHDVATLCAGVKLGGGIRLDLRSGTSCLRSTIPLITDHVPHSWDPAPFAVIHHSA